MTTATPFLMFQGECEKALDLYVAAIPDTRLLSLERYGPERPGPEGKVAIARLSVAGLEIMATDSPIRHDFGFTPSMSIFLTISDPAEVDRLAGRLGDGGQTLMPPDDYGFSRRFAWVADRFGVSWQINAA